mmetsp:Transcript_70615/g.229409  ORF Transcript_70615/g.229409 Transcript_70615/m.229409 type:complete len:85 (+) Transcript_70615:1270-1524(+)
MPPLLTAKTWEQRPRKKALHAVHELEMERHLPAMQEALQLHHKTKSNTAGLMKKNRRVLKVLEERFDSMPDVPAQRSNSVSSIV